MPNNHMLIITLTTCRMKRSTSSGIEDEFYGEVVKDFVSEVKFSEVFGDRVCCSVRRCRNQIEIIHSKGEEGELV